MLFLCYLKSCLKINLFTMLAIVFLFFSQADAMHRMKNSQFCLDAKCTMGVLNLEIL